MRILGIETTCDETAAAVVRLTPEGGGDILADEVMSQIAAHAAYGGVVPEIAARAHIEVVDMLIARALAKAGVAAKDLDGVAAAAGPVGSAVGQIETPTKPLGPWSGGPLRSAALAPRSSSPGIGPRWCNPSILWPRGRVRLTGLK